MKKRDISLVVLFTAFIAAMGLLTAFLPKTNISVNEKRTLAEFPKFSVKSLFNGKWESGFESYISDHFANRDFFAALDSYYTLYSGRNGAKGVYKGKDGYLINTPVKYDSKMLFENISAINGFIKKTGLKSTVIAVPTTGFEMSDRLPKNHKIYRDGDILKEAESELRGNADFIDLIREFNHDKDGLYYKTDHHWTTEGAYRAYIDYVLLKGFAPITDFDKKSYDGFYGTAYSKSALWLESPDKIDVWKYPANVTVTINDGAEDREYDTMFFDEYLEKPDKYPVFLDGNHAFTRIVNHDSDGGKLLVLKDSYAHCLVPFLAAHYSQIDMVDLRYYLKSVSEIQNEQNYDEALFVYGLSSLCESSDIAILE